MSRRVTLRIEPQRLGRYGYEACRSHAATRFALLRSERIPARLGRRAYTVTTLLETFSGAGAERAAIAKLSRLQSPAKSSFSSPRPLWGRSLTLDEYNTLQKEKAARHGS